MAFRNQFTVLVKLYEDARSAFLRHPDPSNSVVEPPEKIDGRQYARWRAGHPDLDLDAGKTCGIRERLVHPDMLAGLRRPLHFEDGVSLTSADPQFERGGVKGAA